MTEEEVSVALFMAATADGDIEVLSWQSVDGKNYFAFDIKLRLPHDQRVEPDLILRSDALWLIEVKGLHSEAVTDEHKLTGLVAELGDDDVREQIYRRAGILQGEPLDIHLAIAFSSDDLGGRGDSCVPDVHHIEWSQAAPNVEADGLAAYLRSLNPP